MLITTFLQKIKFFLGFQDSEKVDELPNPHSSDSLNVDKKNFAYSGTHIDLEDFNGILYNAGFGFQVESIHMKKKRNTYKRKF